MKNKTLLKFLLCFFITSILGFICLQSVALAAGPTSDHFFGASKGVGWLDSIMIDQQLKPVKHIQSLIMYFGIVAALIVITIYAIQWITANPAKRQELKASMWPLVIGVLLLVVGPRIGVDIYNDLLLDSEDGIFWKELAGTSNVTAQDVIDNVGFKVLGALKAAGYVLGSVMILVVAIQWMTSPPNKRQELKGKMTNIFIGAVFLIAGASILGMIASMAPAV